MNEFDRLEAALVDRYPIERPLGAGGMATVYLAHDLKHQRQVAVKVLRTELTATIGAERFLREIGIAARLTHPHILPLHDSGEADGFLYYVMPYVEGESLRHRLVREPQLSLQDALAVAREVADALSYAHSHGVVHRDIKPENILMHAGHALVADFGIARAMSLSAVAPLTATGSAIGTPAYMSPEQISADPHLDNRCDIYSLGCVLYEMLAGQPPFSGPTVDSILRQHQVAAVPAVTTLRPQVPVDVANIIDSTLAKTPADRYPSADALAQDLNRQLALATDPSGAISHVRPLARRRWSIVGTLAVVGAVALLAVALGLLRTESGSNSRVVPIQQQVTFVGNVVRASISPQGDFLAYTTTGADGMTLMVQDLESGSTIEIASSPNIHFPVWSPDGRRILVGIGPTEAYTHKVYPRLGGEPYPLPIVRGIARWSADGQQVLQWSLEGRVIFIHTIASASVARIRTADTSAWVREVAPHPGGNALAVLHAQRGGFGTSIWRLAVGPEQGLAGLARDSAGRLIVGQSEVLIEDDAELLSVEWSLATNALYYLRPDQGSYQLWKLRTATNGAARDAPELLLSGLDVPTQTSSIGLSLLSLTDDGSQLFYVSGRPFWNLWTMRPRENGWDVKPFTAGTATNVSPKASPDGEWVAYKSQEGGRTNVFIAPSEGGAPRQLTHLDSVTGYPVWSPGGESIAFGVQRKDRNVVATVSVRDLARVKIFEATALSRNGTMTWAPGVEILYQRPELRNFHFLNPETGEERPLLSTDSAAAALTLNALYSPDRSQVALLQNRSSAAAGIHVLSLVDGTQRRLNTQPFVSPIGWSADGGTVYVLSEDRRGVLAVPVDGGSPTLLHTLPFEASWIGTTYQGLWFMFSAPGATGDVWRIENFDAER